MTIAVLYIITLAVFLALDFVGLRHIVRPVFERNISSWLRDTPRLGAAVAFYAFYVACLLWFVSVPAIQNDHAIARVFGSAALMGAFAYGTYEFTNLATLKK